MRVFEGSMSKHKKFMGKLAAAVAMVVAPALAGAASPPPATEVDNQAFDWFVNNTPGYLPSPFLTDANAGSVNAFLKTLPANVPHAVKVEVPISNATANLIFNNPSYHISYVLGDLEQANSQANVTNLVKQVRYVNNNNGQLKRSGNAFIGNYGYQVIDNDITTPSNYDSKKGTHSFSGYNRGGYNAAKLNMSMPELYGGSGSFKNPAAGNSTAPNIRSAMFTLPILRVSQVEVNNGADDRNVPYVARFNNFGNLALDTDRNSNHGYLFVPGQPIPASSGFPAVSAAKTANQMLSRRDFAAAVSHYRMRGADSYVLFEPGVIDYTQENKRRDAMAGWTEPHIQKVFDQSDYKLVLGADSDYKNHNNKKDINSELIVDGSMRKAEDTGTIFSGVYSLSLKTLDVMISNLDEQDHSITLPDSIGGYALKTKTFNVDDGSNLLIEYKLTTSGVNKGWSVALMHVPFQAIDNSRNGFGIPEPTTISLAAVTGFLLVGPRRRRTN
jgi:hypothetical protein